MRMIFATAILVLLRQAVAAEPTNCSLIADALLRLRCYEGQIAQTSVTQSLFDRIWESPAAVVAVVAALLAFVSGILGPCVQLCIGKRQVATSKLSAEAAMLSARNIGTREIGRMRLEWMDKLRDTLSEYHAILMSLDDDEDGEARKLSQLGTQLDLLLNQDDKSQKALWDVADAIYNCNSKEARQNMDQELIKAGRAVFKAEWEKVKAEMRGEA